MSYNKYNKLLLENPEKYPKNMGKPWKDDEMLLLLEEVANNKSIEEISKSHERTEGGINAALKRQALIYHFEQHMPHNEIIKITGLTQKLLDIAIAKDKRSKNQEDELIPTGRKIIVKKKNIKTSEVENDSVIGLLKDIKSLLVKLNEKIK